MPDTKHLHLQLAEYGRRRLAPATPDANWRSALAEEREFALLEMEILEQERRAIADLAAEAPSTAEAFMEWYQSRREQGPGQFDPLFDWLAETADREQMRWFIQQEVAGEAGFDDLIALTQLRMPTRPKLEMARNYWDEMGRGKARSMHGPMLSRLADELQIEELPGERLVWEALALGNVLVGLACNRGYAYHSVGALGAVELTAPTRAVKVAEGLQRLGIEGDASYYFRLHAVVDIRHSDDWKSEVVKPLVTSDPSLIPFIAEGLLMRLNAGARCFERYRRHFGLTPDDASREPVARQAAGAQQAS